MIEDAKRLLQHYLPEADMKWVHSRNLLHCDVDARITVQQPLEVQARKLITELVTDVWGKIASLFVGRLETPLSRGGRRHYQAVMPAAGAAC